LVDLRNLKDQAARAAGTSDYAKAAELYLQIADAEPKDPDWRLRAGDALRRKGDSAGAAEQLQLAASAYARAGFLLKAIAACKAVLQLEPDHTATQKLLIELYAQRDKQQPAGAPAPRLLPRGRLATMTLDVPAPPKKPAPAFDPDPIVPAHLELVALDEISLEKRTLPVGKPLEVVPLATVFSAKRSGQFDLIMPDAVTPDVVAEASAYEIALDAFWSATPAPPIDLPRIDDHDLFEEASQPEVPLPKIPLFSSLAPDRLRRLIERSSLRDVAVGEVVVKQGERGGSLFAIVSGTMRVTAGEKELALLGAGECFGEQAILTDEARTATVTAVEATQLIELSRELVSELVADSPDVLRTLIGFFRDRIVERLLRNSPLFTSLSPDDARGLAERFVFLELEPRMLVVREGERAPGLFVLLAGEVEVMLGLASLATLGPGDVFGEMSLLAGKPAMASIVTVRKCWALELPAKQFQEIMMSYPQILEYVSQLAEKRSAENDRVELI
jgi:CRP-like cAMP-binding protein